jgi:hypothetical protein
LEFQSDMGHLSTVPKDDPSVLSPLQSISHLWPIRPAPTLVNCDMFSGVDTSAVRLHQTSTAGLPKNPPGGPWSPIYPSKICLKPHYSINKSPETCKIPINPHQHLWIPMKILR